MRPPSVGIISGLQDNERVLLEDVIRCLSSISFGSGTGVSEDQNIDCRYVTGTSNAIPDTEDSFAHLLKRTPIGFIIISKDKAGDFYNGSGHTSSVIKLKCSVASVTFKALIF